jgi:hypothetical protein
MCTAAPDIFPRNWQIRRHGTVATLALPHTCFSVHPDDGATSEPRERADKVRGATHHLRTLVWQIYRARVPRLDPRRPVRA